MVCRPSQELDAGHWTLGPPLWKTLNSPNKLYPEQKVAYRGESFIEPCGSVAGFDWLNKKYNCHFSKPKSMLQVANHALYWDVLGSKCGIAKPAGKKISLQNMLNKKNRPARFCTEPCRAQKTNPKMRLLGVFSVSPALLESPGRIISSHVCLGKKLSEPDVLFCISVDWADRYTWLQKNQ